jgi:hypothetical protein
VHIAKGQASLCIVTLPLMNPDRILPISNHNKGMRGVSAQPCRNLLDALLSKPGKCPTIGVSAEASSTDEDMAGHALDRAATST